MSAGWRLIAAGRSLRAIRDGRPAVLAVTLLALALRLHLLGEKAIWWDEGWSLYLARQTPARIIAEAAPTLHPPLHYLALHYWQRLLGESVVVARLSSVLCGVITVPLVYRLGVWLGDRPTGLGAALFLAVAPFHLRWSQEIRMYSAATGAVALTLGLGLRLLRRPAPVPALGLGLAEALARALHNGTGLIIGLVNLVAGMVLLGERRPWRHRAAWALAQALALGLFLPWLLFARRHATVRTGEPPLALGHYLQLLATLLPLGVSADLDRYLGPALASAALAILGLGALVRRPGELAARLLPVAGLLGGPALLYLLALPRSGLYAPRIEDRYLLIFLPLYAVALAAGVAVLARRWWPLAGAAVLGLGAAIGGQVAASYQQRYLIADIPALARFLQAYVGPEDVVVLNPDRDWPVYAALLGPTVRLVLIPYGEQMDPGRAAHWLATVRSATVWLIETRDVATTDPAGAVRAHLRRDRDLLAAFDYGTARLLVLSREPAAVVFRARLPAGAQRAGESRWTADLLPRRVGQGVTLYSTLVWSEPGPAPARLILQAEGGRAVLAGRPGPLPPLSATGPLVSQLRLGLPCTASPGPYTAWLELRRGLAVERLPLGRVVVVPTGPVPIGQPAVRQPASLAGGVRLHGFSLSPAALRPGQTLRVTLFWSAERALPTSSSVFVQVLDAADRVVAQHDGVPVEGRCPTTTWGPEGPLADEHTLTLPPTLAPGVYRLIAGLYSPFTGQRLTVQEGPRDRTSAGSILLAPLASP